MSAWERGAAPQTSKLVELEIHRDSDIRIEMKIQSWVVGRLSVSPATNSLQCWLDSLIFFSFLFSLHRMIAPVITEGTKTDDMETR